jgi:hypothetical protein
VVKRRSISKERQEKIRSKDKSRKTEERRGEGKKVRKHKITRKEVQLTTFTSHTPGIYKPTYYSPRLSRQHRTSHLLAHSTPTHAYPFFDTHVAAQCKMSQWKPTERRVPSPASKTLCGTTIQGRDWFETVFQAVGKVGGGGVCHLRQFMRRAGSRGCLIAQFVASAIKAKGRNTTRSGKDGQCAISHV